MSPPIQGPASIFPNAACTTARIYRVVHHAEIIAIEGDSYCKREAQAAVNKPRPSRGGDQPAAS